MQVKGQREGVLIKLDPGSWDQQRDSLMNHLRMRERFYFGSQIALDVGRTAWLAANMGRLIEDLSQHDISLWAILSESEITRGTARSFGLPTEIPAGNPNLVAEKLGSNVSGQPGACFTEMLKPGDKININGNVTVMGDLPIGAEIIASGNVVVWGGLYGSVHAGCEGDRDSVISALEMHFENLQITSISALLPMRRMKQPAITARLMQDKIVFIPWRKNRK